MGILLTPTIGTQRGVACCCGFSQKLVRPGGFRVSGPSSLNGKAETLYEAVALAERASRDHLCAPGRRASWS
jgi:hypothetical protein